MRCQFQSLTAAISALQKEIADIKDILKPSQPMVTGAFEMEDVIHEIEQRDLRKRNIVVFNLTDDNSDDAKKVVDVLNFLVPDHNIPVDTIKHLDLEKKKFLTNLVH
ncbi:hypothetical protein QE152_g6455 [Popillia japonica]|uniref:Uncharacterized protein n=1 Tax=Popillia japonica TaxID=7064 RepID=A0AAW1MGS6_POPJA